MTLQQAKGIFNANYKNEWRESTSEKRRKAIANFWNMYVEQLLYVDQLIDEKTAIEWKDKYYA